jgi:hypothetical protein
MAIKRVFKTTLGSSRYVFTSGKEAAFVGGEYLTDIASEIETLEQEIAAGHPHIYVDSAKATVDTDNMDPLEQIRQKAIADYIASQAAATNPANDLGTSEAGALNPSSSATLQAMAADSSAGGGEAVLVSQGKIGK